MDLESKIMSIIAYSGEARTKAFESLNNVKQGEFKVAEELIQEAKELLNQAHQSQTELLVHEAKGNDLGINMLLIHAQDHLMTSVLALELIQEMVILYER